MPRSSRSKKTEVKGSTPPLEPHQLLVLEVARYVKLVDKVRKSKKQAVVNFAFEEIVNGLRPRIRNLCSKFTIPGLSHDDIYQEALYALRFKAIKDYDKTRGTGEGPAPFDRFALLCIRRHLATELKTSHQIRRRVLNTCISLDQERNEYQDDLSLVNILPHTKGDVLGLIENKEYFTQLVTKLLGKLSKFEREVFLLYVEKYTYEEIAEIINRRKLRGSVNIKGVDNALSRIKHKAQSIFKRMADKARQTEERQNLVNPKSVDNALVRIRSKAVSLNEPGNPVE
jgi:RNA polymerase sigma factor (sigma-70 family)